MEMISPACNGSVIGKTMHHDVINGNTGSKWITAIIEKGRYRSVVPDKFTDQLVQLSSVVTPGFNTLAASASVLLTSRALSRINSISAGVL